MILAFYQAMIEFSLVPTSTTEPLPQGQLDHRWLGLLHLAEFGFLLLYPPVCALLYFGAKMVSESV